MKPIHIIYGTLGVFAALLGAGFMLQGFSLVAFTPWNGASCAYCLLILAGGYLFFRGLTGVRRNFDSRYREAARNADTPRITVEDRLDELERLKRRDLVTPEEYALKRQDILKDL